MGKRPQAILYARVSSKEQAEGYSVDSQLFRLRKETPERGYEVALEVVNIGYERETLFKPGLSEILERASADGIAVVWATRRDRFAASPCLQILSEELSRFDC